MGNVASVKKALNFLGIESVITNNHDTIKKAKSILLPGVGSFAQGMLNLHQMNLVNLLTEEVVNKKKPFLGICLGMQLILEKGSEGSFCEGLGWIKGEVKKIELLDQKIPHMGWNNIDIVNDTYYKNLKTFDFYFIHSYHVVPSNNDEIAAKVHYGFNMVASLQKENIFATQFHPEKSQIAGLSVLKNFFESNA